MRLGIKRNQRKKINVARLPFDLYEFDYATKKLFNNITL